MPLVAGLAAAVALGGCGESDEPAEPPNVIVVMTDDQAMNSYTREAMPNTFELLDRGTHFTDFDAMPPLCCPARATFLTGQYPHNNGVVQNDYKQLRDRKSTLAAWLDESGYNVGLTGKFLNEYHPVRPAPGFDHWWELRSNPGYYGYEVLDGDKLIQAGEAREDYSTLAVTREAVDFIGEAADRGDPFFLWASYYAPHAFNHPSDPVCFDRASQVLPEDWKLFRDAPIGHGPAFNERDISDKPPPSRFPPLSPSAVEKIEEGIRCNLAAVRRVDIGVGRILDELEAAGVEDETAVIFLSDNGYFFGEHRRPNDKAAPYEAALEVPMGAMVPPGVLGGEPVPDVGKPTGTLDLAPTILDLAGAEPCVDADCRIMDGRSLLGLMRGDDPEWPRDRVRLSELGKDCGVYASVQRGELLYTEWYDDGTPPDCGVIGAELYDLGQDPHQLHNLLGITATGSNPDLEAEERRMSGILARMQRCNGVAGRDETENPC